MAKVILLGRGAWERGHYSAEGLAHYLKGASIEKDGGVSLPSVLLSLKLQILRQLENAHLYLKKDVGIKDLTVSLETHYRIKKGMDAQKLSLKEEALKKLEKMEKGSVVGTLFGLEELEQKFPLLTFFSPYVGEGHSFFDFSFSWHEVIALEAKKALLKAYPDVLREKVQIDGQEKTLESWVWELIGKEVDRNYPKEAFEEKYLLFADDPQSEADFLVWSSKI